MPEIKVSSTIMNFVASSNLDGGNTPAGIGNATVIRLMKGIIPTKAELDSIVDVNFRSTDVLITWGISTSIVGFIVPTTSPPGIKLNITLPATKFINASATGLASWIWWHGGGTNYFTNDSNIALSVSTIGGGGEVQMFDTNVVSGNSYGLGVITLEILREGYTY